ncbi:MAG TPA: hypothetical protein VGK20_05725 [Candidatus Binatia bacterium]|jgi:folate-binding protein YgfZ
MGETATGTVEYEGVEVASSCGDVASEWALLDSHAAIVDSKWRRFFTATGDERREYLHGQTSADVASLGEGDGCAAAVLTAQGRPQALVALYELGETIWIATTASHSAAARTALTRHLVADDCDFGEEIPARCFSIAGPGTHALLAAAGAADQFRGRAWAAAAARIAGHEVLLFSRDDLRVPWIDVLICDSAGNAGDAGAVLSTIEAAGARRCGVSAVEIVRIESGCARFAVDVDESRIAVEARLQWAIHFAKGCYVGQEVVERAVSRGRINHELSLVSVAAEVAHGDRVHGGGERDVVTSFAASPRLGPIALAYLPVAMASPGSSVTFGDAGIAGTVLPWPRERTLAGRG